MEEIDPIVNRVTSSPLITLDLNDYFPEGEKVMFDIREHLFQEMLLKEKDFREFIKSNDWNIYSSKNVAIYCTVDAIVPTWAYMLVATKLYPHARYYVFGDMNALEIFIWKEALSAIYPEHYANAKVVIKGCGKNVIPECAYVEVVRLLQPYVSSIMFGEPCSTVPIYKKPR